MEKSSTQLQMSDTKARKQQRRQPKRSTIMFIKQYARIYMPIASMPGISLN